MKNRWMIAIAILVAIMSIALGAVIGCNVGECPPPDHSERDSLHRALIALRADSALAASRTRELEKERNDAIARIRPTRHRLRDQQAASRSLAADSIMRGLLADPPDDLDTLGGP